MPSLRPTAEAQDQQETFNFLSDPKIYGSLRPVRRIDTHGAVVFLAGEEAYKVKRAVKFPFMDFSTLEKRRSACQAEIEVNRVNAPQIYVDAVPIVRRSLGLALGGPGDVIEWAVHMRRFDEEATLDRLADQRLLTADLVAQLAEAVFASHQKAGVRDGDAATASLERYVEENHEAFVSTPDLFDRSQALRLEQASREALGAVKALLVSRGREGHVRRCHGDLHLRNIALIQGRPVLFDAIEFDEAIASIDVLYDLAFLLMDLEERGMRSHANLLLNRYLWRSDESQLSGLAALPLFLSLRAAIRAKVLALARPHVKDPEKARAEEEARKYFGLALDFLKPLKPRLVAIGGLSGTGKSTLSARIAPMLGRSPGAVWLRSDIERKRLFGADETQRLPETAYVPSVDREVYATLVRKARLAIRSGQAALLDAMHAKQEERTLAASLAAELDVDFDGLWLEAPEKIRLERVGSRRRDASDADVAIAERQSADFPRSWRRLDASRDLDATSRVALDLLSPLSH